MRDSWYSDDRDLVKWAALIHLATREQLRAIVQVAMFRLGKRLSLKTASGTVAVPEAVWTHFRDLRRIRGLGGPAGFEISVIDEPFVSRDRVGYFNRVAEKLRQMSGSKAVLLDPDTGFEPGKPNAKHVTSSDVRTIWNALSAGDWLLLYQHRWRDIEWKDHAKSRFAETCSASEVEVFQASASPSDVILLGARKVVPSDA